METRKSPSRIIEFKDRPMSEVLFEVAAATALSGSGEITYPPAPAPPPKLEAPARPTRPILPRRPAPYERFRSRTGGPIYYYDEHGTKRRDQPKVRGKAARKAEKQARRAGRSA